MSELERRLAQGPAAMPMDPRHLGRFAGAAAAAGLLDVAYASADSPLGPLTVFVTPAGLLRIRYDNEPLGDALQETADRISPRMLEAPERTDAVRRQLDEYFEGRRRSFEVPIDWRLVRGFAVGVLQATARVPWGRVTTYREVAGAVGSANASRAVGNALGSNPIPIVVPCHRVLQSGGGVGGYTGGVERKRFLLRLEGAAVV